MYGWIMPTLLGTVVALRVLVFRGVVCDTKTWYMWNFWITSLYALPLIKFHELRV